MMSEHKDYLSPIKVYIPLTDSNYKIANVHVEVGDNVLAGEIVAHKYMGKYKRAVVSSVSGKVAAFIEKTNRFGLQVDHIVIENNRKNEQIELLPYKEEVTSSQVRNRITNLGLEQNDVDGLFTDINFDQKVKHVIVSAVYTNEPFISTGYNFLKANAEEIAEGIKLLGLAAKTESLTIVVDSNMDNAVLDEVGKAIIDKHIHLEVANLKQVNGWDYKVIQKFVQKDLSQNVLNDGVLFVSISTAKKVYDAVRQGIVPTSQEVTFTGDGLRNNKVYDVKIGTLFTDIVEDLGGYNESELMSIHVGNYFTGVQLPSDEFAIDGTVDAVKVSEHEEVEEEVCTKCGDCNDICPAGILPQNIMDAELRGVNARIVDLETHLCVECGLCSYVCPSKINVLEWVRRAKRRVG